MIRLALLVALLMPLTAPARAACEGKIPDFISDICWSCMFPLRVGRVLVKGDGQLDNDYLNHIICPCYEPPRIRIGIPIGFWEPARFVEVTRTPYCLVSLGGLQLDVGIGVREPGARTGSAAQGTTSFAFYHAHWYANPLLHWLGVLLDFDCLERTGFDLAYVSELDPTWEDDQLAAIVNPELGLTASLPAVAACAADCAAATLGWPRDELWWCVGCTGTMYPATGNVAAHVSGRQSSALIAARMAMRMHRTGAAHYTHGEEAQCGQGWLSLRLHKKAYKMSMVLPRAQAKTGGRCCQPFGSSPELWASGSEWPVTGEDFSYLLFRKRDCCAGLVGF